jgi:hypothetical protein
MQRRAESKRAICPLCEESGHSPTRPNNTAHCPALQKSARRTYGPRRRLFPRVAVLFKFSPARSEPLLTSPGAIRFCPPQPTSEPNWPPPAPVSLSPSFSAEVRRRPLARAASGRGRRYLSLQSSKVLRFRCKGTNGCHLVCCFVLWSNHLKV